MKHLIVIFALLTLQCQGAHLLTKQEEQQYLSNLDTIVVDHIGIDRIVFNTDTVYLKIMQPEALVHETSAEQRWVDRHPILFTLLIAILTVLTEVELFKLVLKK